MIVIPMAGLSRRFARAGYLQPKYMLPLGGRTLFAHAVASFRAYFASESFLFVGLRDADVEAFVGRECRGLGVRDWRLELLDAPTAGQAETVERGLAQAEVAQKAAITVFNIDTVRPGYRRPSASWAAASDGYLEVFRGGGANWSYVAPEPGSPEPLARRVAEKQPISDLCCTGLYHFTCAGDFLWSLDQERARPSAPELYVAPLYNHLIDRGARIHYNLIGVDDVVFSGVPAEYEAEREDGRLSSKPVFREC